MEQFLYKYFQFIFNNNEAYMMEFNLCVQNYSLSISFQHWLITLNLTVAVKAIKNVIVKDKCSL